MKLLLAVGAFLVALSLVAHPSIADEIRVFTLRDGSTIKGELIGFANGVYTVQSAQLGRLEIRGEHVVSVTPIQPAPASPPAPAPAPGRPAVDQQVADVQTKIMANPALMQAIQRLANDKELAALLSDPTVKADLMDALVANDPRAADRNPKVKRILEHPAIQDLLKQMSAGAVRSPR